MTGSGIPPKVRALVLLRDEGRCVRCAELITGFDYSVQHRTARGMGGSRHANRPSNLLLMCGSATTGCHGWTESHPALARDAGYRVPAGTDPELWPVDLHGEGPRQLTDDGWALPLSAPTSTRDQSRSAQ